MELGARSQEERVRRKKEEGKTQKKCFYKYEMLPKLNLDQPVAPSTKKFIESVKNNVGESVTPAREAVEKAADIGSWSQQPCR